MNYGRGLRRAREAAGLTVEEMAVRSGLGIGVLRATEDGNLPPSAGFERRLVTSVAEALGFPVELIALLGADPEDLEGITPEVADKLVSYLAEAMAGGYAAGLRHRGR